MKQKMFALYLAMVLVLALTSCGNRPAEPAPSHVPSQDVETPEPSALPGTPTPEAALTFDPALAGGWKQVSAEHTGEEKVDFGLALFFLPDGTVYGNYGNDLPTYDFYLSQGGNTMKTSTQGNKLTLIQDTNRYVLDAGLATQDDLYDLSQVETIYQLSDIQASQTGNDLAPLFFERFDNDLLTIHITGSFQVNPTTFHTIDSTLVYERNYPLYYLNDDYLYPLLVGNWTDNLGNSWSFFYEENEEEKYDFKFRMKDSEGKEHIGFTVARTADLEDPACEERIKFQFEDFSTVFYTITSCDGTTFRMIDEHDEEFTLSRQP